MKRLETGKGLVNVGELEGEFFIPSKMPKNRIPQIWRIPQYRNSRLKLPKYRKKNYPTLQYCKPQCPPHVYMDNCTVLYVYNYMKVCYYIKCTKVQKKLANINKVALLKECSGEDCATFAYGDQEQQKITKACLLIVGITGDSTM